MGRLVRLLAISAIISGIFTFMSIRPAAAACVIASGSNPPSTSLTFSFIQGHSYTISYTGPTNFSFTATAPTSGTGPAPIPPGYTLTITDNSGSCGGSGTFFNPGDGRLDPRPSDRLAIYCNPPVLDVWGVMQDGLGRRLFQFSLGDLAAAGAPGVNKDLNGYGTVAVGYYGGDTFGISWLGGPLNGNGMGDFRKTVHCPFVALGLSNTSGSNTISSTGGNAPGTCSPSVVVQPGDTLFRIATTHGTTVSALVRLNNLTDPNRIQVGQVICLPG